MFPFRARTLAASILLLFGLGTAASAEIIITLDRPFIDRYRNRATIESNFTIDRAHPRPNRPADDGDLHVAGRAPREIGLATVTEIMNARMFDPAVSLVHQFENSGRQLRVVGVWRLWPEHGGDGRVNDHAQGQPLQPFMTTNPPHVFEIHPALRIGDIDVSDGVQVIEGYTPKEAERAFAAYERTQSHIRRAGNRVSLRTVQVGYNYVRFLMELVDEHPLGVEDGRFAFANIRETEGELLVHRLRTVFVRGTGPFQASAQMRTGQCLEVLGIPRIDLALVAWRVDNGARRPEVLDWSLPYEIVIVGTFGSPRDCPDSP